jgi:hypothetical protein
MNARALFLMLVVATAPALAQDESRIHRDFRVEGEALGACKHFDFGDLTSCGQTLVMGQPMHIAVGSLSPQNGFGAGLAFVEHKDYSNEWRATWNADAVATPNGSWRAGFYMKAYRLSGGPIHVVFPGPGAPTKKTEPLFNVAPLLNFYIQSESLNRVDYYGLGPNTTQATHTTYGFSETIPGMNLILPIAGTLAPLKLSIDAELDGRFPTVRPGTTAGIPSIGTLFNEATAPGLSTQTGFFQASEGLRIEPAPFKDYIRLNYFMQFQQYVAPGNSHYSFRRWNGDFNHEIPLYKLLPGKWGNLYSPNRAASAYLQHNGPDDCTGTGSNISMKWAAKVKPSPARPCPIIATTQKLEGSITLRAFISEAFADRGSVVPFYFEPTIGGSDINSNPMLASYPDYRFRGPDLILFRESIQHSLGKLPIGLAFSADQGKIGLQRNDVNLNNLRYTYSAGLTVQAGGLPVIYFLFAWGGNEGHHTTATVSPTLLGGSARPSLF